MRYTLLVEIESYQSIHLLKKMLKTMGLSYIGKDNYNAELVCKTESIKFGELGKIKS